MDLVPVRKSMLVRFVRPSRNSEREAIRKHGDIWMVTEPGANFFHQGKLMFGLAIQSGPDERWVLPDQVEAANDQHGNTIILAPGERWESGKVSMIKV